MLSLTLMAVLTAGAAVPAPAPDAGAAFERIKKLEGSWKTDGKDGATQYVTYRLVGNGASVLELVTGKDRTAVDSVTVYAIENGELVATANTASGTSKMKLRDADASGLHFEAKDTKVAGLNVGTKEPKLRLEWVARDGSRRALDVLREYVDTLK